MTITIAITPTLGVVLAAPWGCNAVALLAWLLGGAGMRRVLRAKPVHGGLMLVAVCGLAPLLFLAWAIKDSLASRA